MTNANESSASPVHVEIGKYNKLSVVAVTPTGVYLDGGELGEILLPNRFVPADCQVGNSINVFIYQDSAQRFVATTEKVLGQVGLGIIVALVLHFNDNVVVREQYKVATVEEAPEGVEVKEINGQLMYFKDVKSTTTTIPFMKSQERDYSEFLFWMSDTAAKQLSWSVFMLVVIVVVTAVSNGANLTDGIDGLAAGTSAIVSVTLAVLAFISGNLIFSDYLNIMFIPNQGELVIYAAALAGACIGFLWYNSFPAQVFMGDTGSLALGGVIAVFALMIRKELVLPILCGVFLAENLSVMLQVSYFKYTKKKYGEGRRIFKMSPLHHHYQKLGYAEPKIVVRFWIVGIMLAIFTIITFKLR